MMIRRNPDASDRAGGCAAEPVRTLKNDHAEPGLRRHQRACHSGGARADHDHVRFHECTLPHALRWAHASPPILLRIRASEGLEGSAAPASTVRGVARRPTHMLWPDIAPPAATIRSEGLSLNTKPSDRTQLRSRFGRLDS